jgi:hypothetical protein
MNAERPTETDSRVWILVKMCSIIPILADPAGTKLPMWARNTIRATCVHDHTYGVIFDPLTFTINTQKLQMIENKVCV